MTTWLFFVALPLWTLSVTNLKSISIFAGCISTCHFCLEINFAILHCILNLESIIFLTAFVAIFTVFEHYWHKFFCLLVLSHTCPLSLVTLKILLC